MLWPVHPPHTQAIGRGLLLASQQPAADCLSQLNSGAAGPERALSGHVESRMQLVCKRNESESGGGGESDEDLEEAAFWVPVADGCGDGGEPFLWVSLCWHQQCSSKPGSHMPYIVLILHNLLVV